MEEDWGSNFLLSLTDSCPLPLRTLTFVAEVRNFSHISCVTAVWIRPLNYAVQIAIEEEKRWRGPQQWRSIFNKLTPRPNTMSWTSLTGKNLTISWTGWAHARIGSGGQGCPIDRVALLHIHMLLTSTTDWLEWTHRCKARRCDQTWCSSNTSPWKNWNFKWMAFRVSFAAGNRGGWRWGPPSLI